MGQQGIHFVRHQYFDALLPDEENKQLKGAVQPGVKEGFAIKAGSTSAKITIEPGILFTGEGDQVELESEYTDVPGLDATANAAVSDRLDLIYCYYRFVESSPAPQPSYGVKLGTAGSPSLVEFGQNQYQIPIGLALVAAGASVYSGFYPFPRVFRVNHFVFSGKEYITTGIHTAMRIMIIPMSIPSLSIEAGIRVEMVEAGTLSDDDEITSWSKPFHLAHDGEAVLNARIDEIWAEIIAARGNMTSLDARFDVSVDEDGTLKAGTVQGHALAVLPGAVTQIVANSINHGDIVDGGIDEDCLDADSVTNDKILDGTIKTRKLANIVYGNCLGSTGSGDLKTMNVQMDQVTITSALDKLKVKDGGIDTLQLADDAVTQAKRAEKLCGRWEVNATKSVLDNTWTDLNFASEDFANLGTGATKSSGPFKIVANRDIYLHIQVAVRFQNATWSANEWAELRINHEHPTSTLYNLDHHYVDDGVTKELHLSGSIVIKLSSGDDFLIQVKQYSGGSMTIENDGAKCWVSIAEV